MRYIDPIIVAEERARLQLHVQTMGGGLNAADALLWFSAHAKPESKVETVVEIKGRLVASSTPKADCAQRYIDAAVKKFANDILTQAIEDADRDYQQAERIRRVKDNGGS